MILIWISTNFRFREDFFDKIFVIIENDDDTKRWTKRAQFARLNQAWKYTTEMTIDWIIATTKCKMEAMPRRIRKTSEWIIKNELTNFFYEFHSNESFLKSHFLAFHFRLSDKYISTFDKRKTNFRVENIFR